MLACHTVRTVTPQVQPNTEPETPSPFQQTAGPLPGPRLAYPQSLHIFDPIARPSRRRTDLCARLKAVQKKKPWLTGISATVPGRGEGAGDKKNHPDAALQRPHGCFADDQTCV
jgi:hypothetical protein